MSQKQTLVIEGHCRLAKAWSGHGVHSEPEDGEEGGDAGQIVSGRELRFTELPLKQEPFDALIGEYAWRAFFNTAPGKVAERLFQSFSRVPLDDKYKNCTVEITFGVSANKVTIEPAAIRNLRVKFTKAGPELFGTFVGPRPRVIEMLDLEDFGGKPVHIALNFGAVVRAVEQQQLALQPAAAQGDATAPQPESDSTETPVDKTRVLEPGQAEREAEASRQMKQALQGLDKQNETASDGGNEGSSDVESPAAAEKRGPGRPRKSAAQTAAH